MKLRILQIPNGYSNITFFPYSYMIKNFSKIPLDKYEEVWNEELTSDGYLDYEIIDEVLEDIYVRFNSSNIFLFL